MKCFICMKGSENDRYFKCKLCQIVFHPGCAAKYLNITFNNSMCNNCHAYVKEKSQD